LLKALWLGWRWLINNTRIDINTTWFPNTQCVDFLGFNNKHSIRKRFLSLSAREFVGENLDFDTKDTLTKENVTGSEINKIANLLLTFLRGNYWLTRVNHESIREFHRFGTRGAKFPRDNNLTTLCTRFHNEAENTITCTVISTINQEHTVEQLIQPRVYISNSHIEQLRSNLVAAPSRHTIQPFPHGI
jgi:hypothetical protein